MSETVLKKFNEYLLNRKEFSTNTINSYDRDLKKIFLYLAEKGYSTEDYSWLNEEFVSRYIDYLKDKDYSSATLSRTISTVHIFVEYLWIEKIIPNRVNIEVHIDKEDHHDLVIFTRQEIAKILDVKTNNLMGYRDKAIFELSYSIGIKPTECINLELKDINTTIGYLKYRKKEGYRTIALNRESVEAIENYIVELKKEYPKIKDDSKLFLNHDGEGISRQGFWKIFKKRQQDLGLTKELNTMNFRNSLAIHLLEDKVPAEEVQELLGLKNINSLKLYFSSLEGNKSKRMMTNHPRKTIN
ncbi:tyrosine-type recombinase/integrase [uncultured Gemella sp.]|uniref:tyrosine-type recombinase/integrase n=1 Tax=uncultured Gemella sp. TaxID=254352 RepID=UPI0028D1A0EA|nr:tyrosine-type recombinase/integrase [uncultured Gemella sp.]